VSEICLGTMTFSGENYFGGVIGTLDQKAATQLVGKSAAAGVNFIDTADAYSHGQSEIMTGQAIRDLGLRRSEIVLATKVFARTGPGVNEIGGSRVHIMDAVAKSLERLKTDYIDLSQIHQTDLVTPVEEIMRALDDLVRQGKVRYIGCSNLPAWEVVEAQWTAKHHNLNAFVSCQDEYSLVVRDIEKDLVPAMQAYNLGLLPFFPLASGLLTGKYKRNAPLPEGTRLANTKRLADRYISDANWAIVERLSEFASARGHTMLELAFSWLASRPYVSSVIAGATKPEQIDQNIKAVDWALTPEEIAEIDKISAKA
jgi:aryl-alcohol dehydrogenase-like predicted oxidoreductase